MVILVDENDKPLGTMPKLEAHEKGLLHRAFSILVFNTRGELLLQRRALDKYHSGGMWTNTCCSHPAPGEAIADAAQRRLMQEMGMECELEYAGSFIYSAEMVNGLTEHELDHILVATSDELPSPDDREVAEFKYMPLGGIREDICQNPDNYAAWFKIIMENLNETSQP